MHATAFLLILLAVSTANSFTGPHNALDAATLGHKLKIMSQVLVVMIHGCSVDFATNPAQRLGCGETSELILFLMDDKRLVTGKHFQTLGQSRSPRVVGYHIKSGRLTMIIRNPREAPWGSISGSILTEVTHKALVQMTVQCITHVGDCYRIRIPYLQANLQRISNL